MPKPVKSETKLNKTPAARLEKTPTGIEGLDEVMGGGFEKNSVNLVGGGAGAGKSILAMQFLINGIKKFNEPGIFITFEETKKKIYKHMLAFGWDLEKYEKQKKFALVEYAPQQVKKVLSEGGGLIESVITKIKAKRLVIDSLTSFNLLFKDELEKRKASLDLFKLVSKWGCTTLVTVEEETDPEKHISSAVEFEVDGVILLYNIRKGNVRERALEVLKLRGIKHSTKVFPIKIGKIGITVYPQETVF